MELENKIKPVDIHSIESRREAGLLWYNDPFVRDPSVWTKTPKEKRILKKLRRTVKSSF